jgi:RNA polymerase sigma factor (sigma-70 family)
MAGKDPPRDNAGSTGVAADDKTGVEERLDEERPLAPPQQKLVTENRAWARDAIRRLARVFGALLSAREVEQLADLGLSKAARRYDRSLGVPFRGFALKFVRGAVKTAGNKAKAYYDRLIDAAEGWTEEGDLLEETDEEARDKLFARARQGAGAMVLGGFGRATFTLAAGGEAAIFRAIASQRLPEGLAALKPRTREVVERRFLQEQEIKEIAAEMDISEITVRRAGEEGLEKLWRFFLKQGIDL